MGADATLNGDIIVVDLSTIPFVFLAINVGWRGQWDRELMGKAN